MGWLPVAVGVVACILLYDTEKWIPFWVAVVSTVGTLLSYGVMFKIATEAVTRRVSYTRREDYKGASYDITEFDVDFVPNLIARINLLFAIVSFGLLLYGGYAKYLSL